MTNEQQRDPWELRDGQEPTWKDVARGAERIAGSPVSRLRFFLARIIPLGCIFLPAFFILLGIFAGILSLIGQGESVLAGQAALVGALVCAAILAIVVFKRVVERWWWYRRLL